MAVLTIAERKWVEKVNKILAQCPSKRIAFATIGDCDVTLFDVTRYHEICEAVDNGSCDFIPSADRIGAVFDEVLRFPNQVESTAG
jgi:hypothetical protein|nr:MAG TPA: hypothetical protein [Caudoviricetes sp.]